MLARFDPQGHWQRLGALPLLLLPLSLLFRGLVFVRRWSYRLGLRSVYHADCPVIVVGNITVGGAGKTPLVIWLSQWLEERGWRPGIVSRGYGGHARHWPQQVRVDSDPRVVGDEAVLLAQRCGRPVCVGPDRPAAVQALLAHTDCDIVISDDGLQHYALGRDLEIVVIDGQRRFGNRLLLPAGPLREPVSRLRSADLVICNGKPHHGEHAMRLRRPRLLPLRGNAPPVDIERLRGRRVRAIAGIGNPQRFFDLLRRFGLQLETHVFPDHHAYVADDLAFDPPMPLLMTEKDAVKCRHLAPPDSWVLRIEVQPDAPFLHRLGLAVEDFNKP